MAANGSAFLDAVNLANDNKGLDVGVHLCLTTEKAILSKEDIPTLVDKEGKFFRSYKSLLFKLHLKKINILEVEKELEAQIRKVIDANIKPTHVDSHNYIHMDPLIFNVVVKLAKKYKIRYVRSACEKLFFYPFCFQRLFIKIVLICLAMMNKRKTITNNIVKIDNFCGFSKSGDLDRNSFKQYISKLKPGVTEMVCHPGTTNVNKRYSLWNYNWQKETDTLIDITIINMIKQLNIELINFKNMDNHVEHSKSFPKI